jgi:hypothetical protein
VGKKGQQLVELCRLMVTTADHFAYTQLFCFVLYTRRNVIIYSPRDISPDDSSINGATGCGFARRFI